MNEFNTYDEVIESARENFDTSMCKACKICDGKACGNTIPGPGSKGNGETASRNYFKWKEIKLELDTIYEGEKTDTTFELFGKQFKYPFFAGPVGAVKNHYGSKYDDRQYNNILLPACAQAGIAAFTGDGLDSTVMEMAVDSIRENDGIGVPTIKPWNMDLIKNKMKLVEESGAFAVAMDIDAAGLPFLKNMQPPAGKKTVSELSEIAAKSEEMGMPFIIKGIMNVKGALKAKEAGAKGIVVSNHGGRVLDECPSTAEVLPEIVSAVSGEMKIFVDGGIRTGIDVFKALAIGADAVLIARPFVTAVYGGERQGVTMLIDKIGKELVDAMEMCGAPTLSDINADMIREVK